MTIRTLGYIQFKTHNAYISQDDNSQLIYCFKATQTRCDLQTFTDQDAACDYILKPFDSLVYELVIAGDNQRE
jgi:hypothetical protein